jgi:hypothetical protein
MLVADMREEAQYAVWYWIKGPAEADTWEEEGWHPCFDLPASRKVVEVHSRAPGNESLRVLGRRQGSMVSLKEEKEG